MNGTSEGPAPAADLGPAITESDEGLAPRAVRTEPPAYRSVFTTAPLAMAVVDAEGLVVSANDTLGTLLGTDPDALAGPWRPTSSTSPPTPAPGTRTARCCAATGPGCAAPDG